MNAVIYARYSSDKQSEQSIEGQLAYNYEYAERNGYTVVNEYIDRALSAKSADKRDEFLRMIKDSETQSFDAVIVYQLDRFGRNIGDIAHYMRELEQNGVILVSARENIGRDASGKLFLGVLMGMAEYYSDELSQKVLRGMNLNADKCLSLGGHCPLGYSIDKEKRFQLDPENVPVVQKIFKMYATGSTVKEICGHLNAQQIKTSSGSVFNKNSLRKLLQNPNYIGTYTGMGRNVPDAIPRIVSNEVFRQVQARMNANKKAPARARAREEYLLTTKLFCGYDREMMIGVSGTGKAKVYHYYSCKNVYGKSPKKCNKKNVKKSWIEDFVIDKARAQLTDDNIARIAEEVEKIALASPGSINLKRLEKALRENEKAVENLLQVLERGDISEVITERIAKKKGEQKALEAEIAAEKIKSQPTTAQGVRFFLGKLKTGDINNLKYRRALIAVFVSRIYLYDNKVTIIFNSDGNPLEVDYDLINEIECINEEVECSFLGNSGPP